MLAIAALSLLLASPCAAEDREYIQAVTDAQKSRPARLSSASRIAPEIEPGTALVLHGRAFAADGKTPLVDAVVFAYHTDKTGIYAPRGGAAHTWRLKGWAKTDAAGRFEFRTIRPGAYPGGKEPAHIHVTLFTAEGVRYHAGAALFDDDPLVPPREREATKKDPVFGPVRPVRREGTTEHIDFNLKIDPKERF